MVLLTRMAQSNAPTLSPPAGTPITLWPEAVQTLLALDDRQLKSLLRKLRKEGLVAAA